MKYLALVVLLSLDAHAVTPFYLRTAAPEQISTMKSGRDGHNFAALELAASGAPKKTTFETQAEFEAKLDAFYEKPAYGAVRVTDRLVRASILLPEEMPYSGIHFKYDAEAQTMRFCLDNTTYTVTPESGVEIFAHGGTKPFGTTSEPTPTGRSFESKNLVLRCCLDVPVRSKESRRWGALRHRRAFRRPIAIHSHNIGAAPRIDNPVDEEVGVHTMIFDVESIIGISLNGDVFYTSGK